MSKKALLALLMAVLIPAACYLAVKWTSERAIVMPRRFLVDTIIENNIDGKKTSDTVWHKTANIKLINQLGDSVNLYDIKGKVIVMDFIFTRCPYVCPALTRNMAKLQKSFSHYNEGRKVVDSSIVRFISFTIDPERDSVKQLKNYADKYGVDHDNWWMLTGNKKTIYDFALNELKVGIGTGENEVIDTSFMHTQYMVMLDRDYVVRGFYRGLDTTALARLAEDVGLLMLEKDKTKKRDLFRK